MSVDRKEDAVEAAVACSAAVPAAACPCEKPLRLGWRRLRQAFRQLFGMPDYERYRVAERDDGEAAPSRSEFFVRSGDRRYGRSGSRCC